MNAVRRLVSAVFATFLSFGKFVILGGSEGEVMSLSDTKSHLPAIIL